MFDYVPLTLEKQPFEISESAIDENVNETTNDNNALSLSKAIRYDGLKIYNGGDLNYFDGSIKADGKFNFKTYVEVYDFVSATYDEQNFSAQILS